MTYGIREYREGRALCMCGCGQPAPIATITHTQAGRRAGRPCKFVRGHNSRVRNPNRRTGPMYIVDEDSGCWIWQRCIVDGGYGRVWNGKQVVQAHRHYYALKHGEIPNGVPIHHVCRNRACVNPDHLEALDDAEHRSMHSKHHAEIVRIVLASGISLDELAERLGVR